MQAREPLLRLEHVKKTFDAGSAGATPVLTDVELELAEGESLAIVGPSGCGKSTLLALAGGLDAPSAGRVLFGGRDLAALPERERARVRNRELGFVFQHHHLLPQLSALENALLPALAEAGRVPEESRARAEALLARVGLAARLGHRPAALSGGERQRVAVVRALVLRPRLVLADEPTGSLDAAAADALAELFAELNREQGVAVLLVTHAPDLAARMGGIATLRAGRLERQDACHAAR